MSDNIKTEPSDLAPSTDAGEDMHIHKPKAAHSLREFAAEISVIVVGVLIALALEQVVEAIHSQVLVQEAREALAAEISGDTYAAVSRLRLAACVDRRLDALGGWFDKASAAHRLPPMGPVPRPRRAHVTSTTWASFIASPVANRLRSDERAHLRDAYFYVDSIRATQEAEKTDWDTIWTLVGPGRTLDPAEEPRLRQAIISARSKNIDSGLYAANFMSYVRELDLPYTEEQRRSLAKVLNGPIEAIDQTGECRSQEAAPPDHYGLSPDGQFLSAAQDALAKGPRLGSSNGDR